MTETDRIERQIEIAASAQRVWELISRPGWFINDGAVIDHRIEHRGDVAVVHDPVHGAFPIVTVRLDPPRYAAFRWLSEQGTETDLTSTPSTLVEFWIEQTSPDAVLLRVVESGFASLAATEAQRRRMVEENTSGWETELTAARAYLDPLSVHRARHIDAPPADVWPIVTTAEHFARWYAFDGAEIDARPGGTMRLTWAEHGSYLTEVVTVEEPHRFAYRIAAVPDTVPTDGNSTLVTLTLTASGRGTLLTVDQTGYDRLAAEFGTPTDHAAQDTAGWVGALATLGGGA